MAKPPVKKNTVKVNFTGVETSSVVPEGEYITAISGATLEEGEKGEYIKWEAEIGEGKYAGKKLYTNTSLAQQSLWATKRMLEALGLEVPNGEMVIDFDECVGLPLGVVVEHDVYKGKTKSQVVDIFPVEGAADEAEPDPASTTLPTDDEIDEMGKADLKELVETHGLDVELTGATAAQRRAVKKAMTAKREEAPADEPAPKKADKAPAKPKVVKYKADDIGSMSDEELAEIIEKHELDVDADLNLRKKRAKVADELEEAKLLEDE